MYHIRVRACALIIENDSVLLIQFTDEDGIHYNLPAGGTEPGETIIEAVKREAFEEAGVDVEVGELVFVSENAPHMTGHKIHGLSLMFRCHIKEDSIPTMPLNPDPNQTGVKWVPINELDKIILFPNIKAQIIKYAKGKHQNNRLIEEYKLKEQLI
ncbi:NUDIX hydrolase [Bacillus sp. FJAT-25509]|uniref:NUDIX domain-containing protein n=1 Tax=Bacillaceae TaxID=186817 RepID=UPI0006F4BC3D|nr:NUDIX domain-containing protein [Bacillus sp. FJAT-25509]KQL32941.1 NUDIX hydrolase [Bacillus sp. FJAT-25509]